MGYLIVFLIREGGLIVICGQPSLNFAKSLRIRIFDLNYFVLFKIIVEFTKFIKLIKIIMLIKIIKIEMWVNGG